MGFNSAFKGLNI